MKIQIQTVTWNSEHVIKKLLISIQALNPCAYRVVVIDNDSKDTTKKIVSLFSGITLIHNNKNNGFANAHNQGFALAQDCEAVICINPDIELTTEALRIFETIYQNNSNVGSIGGKLLRPTQLTKDQQISIIDTAGIQRHFSFKFSDIASGQIDTSKLSVDRKVFANSGACIFLPMDVCKKISLSQNTKTLEVFDSSFFAYKEDIDLGWRIHEAGLVNINSGKVLGTHIRTLKKGGGHSSRSHQHLLLSYRNHLLLLSKHLSKSLLLKYGIFIGFYELGKFVFLFLLHPKVTLQAIQEFNSLRK